MTIASRTDLENVFGPSNIGRWADLENDRNDAFITSRVNSALSYADALFVSRIEYGPYKLPLPSSALIIDVVSRIAGVWLYESRGISQDDAENSPIAHHRKYINDFFTSYLRGGVYIPGADRRGNSAPHSIEST